MWGNKAKGDNNVLAVLYCHTATIVIRPQVPETVSPPLSSTPYLPNP